MKKIKFLIILTLLLFLPSINYGQSIDVTKIKYNNISFVNVDSGKIIQTNDNVNSFILINKNISYMTLFIRDIITEDFFIIDVYEPIEGVKIYNTISENESPVSFLLDKDFLIIGSILEDYYIVLYNE